MKVSACSFVNNGKTLGYPFVESIQSALKLVVEYVVAVGPSEDGTRKAIEQIDDPRFRIIDTTWAPDAPRGFVYSQQTLPAPMPQLPHRQRRSFIDLTQCLMHAAGTSQASLTPSSVVLCP